MITLKIFGLVLCLIVACLAIKKIVEHILNLMVLLYNKKTHKNMNTTGIVFNKKSKKLEDDNSPNLPFQ